MKTYLFRFMTNYEEAGIIIVTAKGLEYAKKKALELGAWDTNEVTEIRTDVEFYIEGINFGFRVGVTP